MILPPTRRHAPPRRGMLLLLVLSVLALFLLIGGIGILVALRARETARSFAAALASDGDAAMLARTKLDEALLKLIRGPSGGSGDVTESLLEDKYWTTVQSCTITSLSSATTTTITGSITSIMSTVAVTSSNAAPTNVDAMGTVTDIDTTESVSSGSYTVIGPHPTNPAAFAGRVLTLVPDVGDPTGPTSYRILRFQPGVTTTTGSFYTTQSSGSIPASGTPPLDVTGTFWNLSTSGSFWLANVKPRTPLPLPNRLPCEAVINGREFRQGQRMRSGTFGVLVRPDNSEVLLDGLIGRNEPYDAFMDRIEGNVPPNVPNNPLPTNAFLTVPVLQGSTVDRVDRAAFGGVCEVDNDGDGVADGSWLPNVLAPQRSSAGGQFTFAVSYLVLDLDGRINLNAHGSFSRAQVPRDPSPYPPEATGAPVGMGYGPADVDAALAVAGQAAGSGTNRWALLLQGGEVTKTATTSMKTWWRPTPPVQGMQPGRYTTGTAFATAAPGNGTSTTGTNSLNADYWMVNPAPNSPTDLKAELQVFTDSGTPPTLTFARPSSGTWTTVVTDTTDVVSTGVNTHPYALRLDDDAPRASGTSAVDSPFTVGELERILRQFDADASTLAPRLAALLDDFAERSRMTVTTDSWDTPAITGSAALRTGTSVVPGTLISNVHSPEVVAGLRFNLNRPLVSGSARYDYFRQLYTLVVALGVPAADAAQWAANVIEFRDPDSVMTWYPYDTNPLDGTWDATGGAGVWGSERPEMVITSGTYDASDNKVTFSLYRPWKCQLRTGTVVTGSTELIDSSLGNRTKNELNLTGTVPAGTDAIWKLAIAGSSTIALGSLLPAGSGTTLATNSGTTITGSATSSPPRLTLLRLADPYRAVNSASTMQKNEYVPVSVLPLPPIVPPLTTSTTSRTLAQWWLHWPNRDLVSHGELLTVPSGTAASVGEALFADGKEAFLALTGTLAVTQSSTSVGPLILDATIVPSRFAGANVSVASGPTFLGTITGFENFQYGQFSRWREAGRVNVNTILPNTGNTLPTLDNAVQKALGGAPPPPIQADRDLLVTGAPPNVEAVFARGGTEAKSAFLKASTAIRLANCATTRSHVFAVWITLKITDSSPNAGPPQYARLFAIVDRSIPVGYAPGRTLNARETILLQRFLP